MVRNLTSLFNWLQATYLSFDNTSSGSPNSSSKTSPGSTLFWKQITKKIFYKLRTLKFTPESFLACINNLLSPGATYIFKSNTICIRQKSSLGYHSHVWNVHKCPLSLREPLKKEQCTKCGKEALTRLKVPTLHMVQTRSPYRSEMECKPIRSQ